MKTAAMAAGAVLVVASAFAGYNEYTKTVNGTVADVTLTANDTIISDKLSGNGIDTLRFTRGNNMYSVKLRSTGGNDLSGGIIADGYLLKIQDPNVLGTGPVQLVNQWSGIYGDVWSSLPEIDVHNRVVFDTIDSYAAGEDTKNLILHNIGVTDKNSAKAVTLGREGTGVAKVTLALDGSDNDPIGYFNLRGNLALTLDGGTIRAASTGGTRALFQPVNAQATPAITVLNAPLTVDVAEGGDVSLGVSPTTYSKTHTIENVVEEYKPDNYSFESGNTGWTFSNGGSYSNGSAFDANGTWGTTNGTKYAMVRQSATLSRNIDLPSAGSWRVVFEQGCRDGSYSQGMTTTVTIDGATVMTIPALSSGQSHGFQEFRSEPVQLAQGSHAFQIALSSAGQYNSMNFDVIRFERCESTTPNFSLAKTGAGSLTLTGSDFPSTTSDLTLAANGGTLTVADASLNGNSIAVGSGGELVLSGVAATNTQVSVASGGKVAFGAAVENLVVNGGFETPTISDYGFQWASACSWNLEPTAEPRPGLQHNGGTLTPTYDQTPYGDQSLYLRTGTTASQSISVPVAGNYVLSFWQAPRNYASSNELGLTVTIDDNEVVVNAGKDARYEPYRTSQVVSLEAGSHTLKFACASGGKSGSMVFVDDVSLKAVQPANDFSKSTLALSSGSTVRLNGVGNGKVVVGTVTVDGVEVRGGADALRSKGVSVEGAGSIKCGGPLGLVVLIR